MSDSNQITVRGRVGTDPDVLVTANGRQMTKFRLGSTRSYRDATGEWREVGTEWFTVKVWGPFGQAIRDSLHRGMPVIVQGTLSSEEWTSGDRTHHTNVITATAIGVDIKYGLVTFAKITRQAPADTGEAQAEVAGTGGLDGRREGPAEEPEGELPALPGEDEEPAEPMDGEADEEPGEVLEGSPLGRDPWVKVGG